MNGKAERLLDWSYGMNVLGTVRILINAKDAGLIPGIKEIIQQMRANGYWIHDSSVSHALQVAGEK
jgi:predicted nucleic acid-binding protein